MRDKPAHLIQRIEAIADRGDAAKLLRELGMSRKESDAFISRVKAALLPPPEMKPEEPLSEPDVISLLREHVINIRQLLPST